MNISLLQLDGYQQNLPLMKISSFYKSKGHSVRINHPNPDKVYISTILRENETQARGIATMFNCPVIIGGSGYSLKKKLPYKIEHIKPDYDLFNCTYSVGFTSRGCFRNCPFCIVTQKEGRKIIEWSPFDEFIDDRFNHIVLYDANFIGSPKAIQKIKWLIENKYTVNFNQGLDLRLMTEEIAILLRELKFRNYSNTRSDLYFAWDQLKDENTILKGLQILYDTGIAMSTCNIYVLTGFTTTLQDDLYRIEKLIDLGCQPYVMRYNNIQNKTLKSLQRWCNRRYYRKCTFIEYQERE